MGTDAMNSYQSKAGVPVVLKITVGYGQPGSSVLGVSYRLPPPPQPNPLTETLTGSGATLWGQVIRCVTMVTATNPATLKTGVTYELTGVGGPSPVVLEQDAKAIGDTIPYTAAFFFHQQD
jgi:hypothetical protein